MPSIYSTVNGSRRSGREEIDRCAEAFQAALNRGQGPSLNDFLRPVLMARPPSSNSFTSSWSSASSKVLASGGDIAEGGGEVLLWR